MTACCLLIRISKSNCREQGDCLIDEKGRVQTIFKAGEKAEKVYFLVRGSVDIFLPDNDSKDPNFLISENELFGEMGVIDDELRMADARCMEESELVSITREEFNKILSESNVFVRGVLGVLSARLRSIQKHR